LPFSWAIIFCGAPPGRVARISTPSMEVVATLLALMVGVLALVRFYTKRNNTLMDKPIWIQYQRKEICRERRPTRW
jgi:hypothetical protein